MEFPAKYLNVFTERKMSNRKMKKPLINELQQLGLTHLEREREREKQTSAEAGV